MSFDEKVARAKAAQEQAPAHKDVPVSLDSPLTEERGRVLGELGTLGKERERVLAQEQRLTMAPDTSSIDARMNELGERLKQIDELDQENLITVRLYRHRGGDWLDLVAGHPPRLNSAMDRQLGYNVNTGTIAALVSHGRILDGDEELVRDDTTWITLTELLSGGEFVKLANAVCDLNFVDAQNRTAALKNFSGAALASDQK